MYTDSGMTGISLSGYMPYMTVASLEMSDEPRKVPNWKNLSFQLGKFIFPVGKCQKRSWTDFGR